MFARHKGAEFNRGPYPLPGHLHEPELRNAADPCPCLVVFQMVPHGLFNIRLVLRILHIDKIDNDQSAQIP